MRRIHHQLFTLIVLTATTAGSAHAQDTLQLPSPGELRALFEPVPGNTGELAEALHHGGAETCRMTAEMVSCRALALEDAALDTWQFDGRRVVAEGVEIRDEVWAESLVDDDGALEVRNVRVRVESGATWHFSRLICSGDGCSIEGVASAPTQPPDPGSPKFRFTASHATWVGEGWRVEGSRLDGYPVGELETGHAKSGIMPPRVRFARETFEFDASALVVSPIPVIVTAVAAPGQWYGIGAGIVTGREQMRLLEVQPRWHEDGEVRLFANGSAVIHVDETPRLGARLERPSTDGEGRLRALENDAWLRDFTTTEFGGDASGGRHVLTASALLVDHFEEDEDAMGAWDVFVRYGTRLEFEHLRLDLDIDERTRMRGAGEEAHSTTGSVTIAAPLGDATRAILVPRVDVLGNFGVIPEELGFESSTVGQVVAGLDASLALAGRFDGFTHYISPGLTLRREAFGIRQRPLIAPTSPAFFLYDRVEDWTFAGLKLDQRFGFSSWEIELPLGVALSGAGVDEALEKGLALYAGIFVTAEAGEAEVLAVCDGDCATLQVLAQLKTARFAGISAYSRASRLSDASLRMVNADARLLSASGVATMSRRPTGVDGEWTLSGGAESTWGPWGVELEAFARPDGDVSGARAAVAFDPLGLGWGLVGNGAWRFSDDELMFFVGFRAR